MPCPEEVELANDEMQSDQNANSTTTTLVKHIEKVKQIFYLNKRDMLNLFHCLVNLKIFCKFFRKNVSQSSALLELFIRICILVLDHFIFL